MRRYTIDKIGRSTGFSSTLALALVLSAPIITLSAVGLSGCGGSSSAKTASGSGTATKSAAKGRAALTFLWPKRANASRLIPVDANSIQVAVSDSSGLIVATQTIARPTTGATSATVTFDRLPVATYTVTATAFPSTDGTGIAQAKAQTSVTIVADQVVPITLTLASTITALTIATQTATLPVGKTVTLIATPTDAQGSVVLVAPSTLQWSSSTSGVATVDSNGLVTGVSAGSATITVTETESGKSASLSLTVSAPLPVYATAEATAYQMNPAHSGVTSFGQALTFPSHAAWSVDLGHDISYPIIAGGKVFVTVGDNNGAQGTQLYALDAATGATVWGPTGLGAYSHLAGLTYENGKVFAVNGDGLLQSFDAATGTPGWAAKLPGQYGFSAAPTAANGIVYVGGAGTGGTLYAVDENSGKLLWTAAVENGDQSSPAVSNDGVFVSYPCQVYKFDLKTGSPLWRYNGPCEGGGGKTAAYSSANNSLYVRDNGGVIYDAATGNQTGAFNASQIPALGAKNGYLMSNGTLGGINLASRQQIWSFTGDGHLTSAPIAVDQVVFVGSASGTVYAVDAATGSPLWSDSAGAAVDRPDEQNGSQPLTGLAAGEGYLVVPAETRLTAWRMVGP